MWRAEAADPRLRANVTLLELLDPAPDWDRLLRRARVGLADGAADAAAGGRAGAGRRRARGGSPSTSSTSTGTSTGCGSTAPGTMRAAARRGRRVRRRRRSTGTGRCGRCSSSRASPDGRAGYVVKTHHSTTDGLGAVQLMSRLHSRAPDRDPARPEPAGARWRRYRLPRRRAHRAARAARSGRRPLELLRRADAEALARADGTAAAQARRRSPGRRPRTLAPPRGGGSPLLAARGGGWHFEVLEVPLADAQGRREGGRAARSTTGSSRRCSAGSAATTSGSAHPLGTLPLGIPISLRAAGRPAGRQPVHRRALPRPAGRDRPGRADPGGARVRPVGAGAGASADPSASCSRRCWPGCPAPVIGAMSGSADQRQRRPGVEHARGGPPASTSPGRASCGCTRSARCPAARR